MSAKLSASSKETAPPGTGAGGPPDPGRRKLFFGWVILAVLCFDHFILLCGYLYTFGSTVDAMVVEFGSTMTAATMAKTCYSFSSALAALSVGWVISRRSARLCLLIGGGCGVAGSLLMAFWVRTMPRYIFCCVVFLSTMTMFGSGTAAQTIVSRWFRKKRSVALAILLSSGGVGGFVFPTLTSGLIQRTGSWHSVWLVVLAGSVIATLLSAALLRDWPEEKGLRPDGEAQPDKLPAGPALEPHRLRAREFLLDPVFLAGLIAHSFCNFSLQSVSSYVVPTFTEKGLSLGQASLVLSVYAFVNFFSRLASGPALQRFEARQVYSFAMLTVAAACFTVPFITRPWAAYAFGGVFGLGYGLTVLCVQTIYLQRFGVENFGSVSSVYTTLVTFSAAALNLVPGLIHSLTGNFHSLYYLLSAGLVSGTVLIRTLGSGKRRPRRTLP